MVNKMLVTKTAKIKWNSKTKKWYEDKGYKFTKIGDEFEIKIEDLTSGSHLSVEVECDECGKLLNVKWQNYNRFVKDDGNYYCSDCSRRLFGTKKMRNTKFLNSTSFYDWCYINLPKEKADEIMTRWDYELNKCRPDEVCYSTGKKYYFKCPRKLHPSELKNISSFTSRIGRELDCDMCNSFAQYHIDNTDSNFLEKYWDWERNTVNPWYINYSSPMTKVWIKCQEKDYHRSYYTSCGHFSDNHRCPYCSTFRGKVHPLDSFGKLLEDLNLLWIWSDKNEKSLYEYTVMTKQKAWFKCLDEKHEDYYRNINNSVTCNFRCPNCQSSKGEIRINEYLKTNNINFKSQYRIRECKDKRALPFDFAIFLNNELHSIIEYDGMQHSIPVNFSGSLKDMMANFELTQKRDKIKNDYCNENNIKLIRIPYTDYDNIEKILDVQFKSNVIKK